MTSPNPAADALGITELKGQVATLTDLVRQLLTDVRPMEYTVAQVAAELGCSERTVKRRMDKLKAQGKITAGARTIPRDILDQMGYVR